MRRRSPRLIKSILPMLLFASVCAAQQAVPPPPPPPPPTPSGANLQISRDNPSVAMSGTASISGIVTSDDEANAPLRRVTLQLSRSGVNDVRTTGSDDRGRFLFSNLPAGSYLLSGAKGAYVTSNYGAIKPGLPGSPIPIVDGQQFVAHALALTHGAVITGKLTDSRGRPVPGTSVAATQFQVVNGERRPRAGGGGAGQGQTDQRGNYRIFGLAPGEYIVYARLTFFEPQDVREVTPEELLWAQQQVKGTRSSPSAVPTTGATAATGGNVARSRSLTPAPTFYPSTEDAAGAGVITVGRGEERPGIDFHLQNVPTARISGSVVDTAGHPVASAVVVRVSALESAFLGSVDFGGTSRTNAGGHFTLSSVGPGQYTITVRSAPPAGRAAGAPAPVLWGMADVSVNGDDIDNLVVQLQLGMNVSGKILLDGNSPKPPDLTTVQPRLVSQSTTTVTVNATPTTAQADGAFKITDVTPGAYRMQATLPTRPGGTSTWTIASATLDGRNVLDFPLDVHPGTDVDGIVVTLSDKHTELSGHLVDGAGQPAPQFYVLAFSADRSYWTSTSRWVRQARAGVDGQFKIADLPPGEYYVCALTELAPTQLSDPSFLEQLMPASIKMQLTDGEKKTQDLRIGGL